MKRRNVITWGAISIAGLSRLKIAHAMNSIAPKIPAEMDALAFHASRKFADTPFGKIAYVERGLGKAALFLHGFSLNGFQWRGLLTRLSTQRRCIAMDFMGMGYSQIPEGQSVAPDAQVEMLAAFLDKLSLPKVDLIANDSGGAVAQLFVARYPQRVRSLLLTNCDAHDDSPPPSFLPFVEAARKGVLIDGITRQLNDKSLARSAKGIGGQTYSDPSHPADEAIDCYFTPLGSSPLRKQQFHDYAIALDHNVLAGIEPALSRSPFPVRIVWGSADTIFDPASADWLAHVFPHSLGVRRVDGAKLFFPEEFPDLLAEELRALWKHG
jgi:haloalkane dehalogenase